MSEVDHKDAIINPKKGKRSPQLGPTAVMAATETDLVLLCDLLDFDDANFQKLFISRLFVADQSKAALSLTGPLIGAPYATMLLETLIAWGAQKIIFLGWGGSICEKVKIGDIILPTSAIIDEGTSRHYQDKDSPVARPSELMITRLKAQLEQNRINFHPGAIWTTDALYRETRSKVAHYQRQEAIGVEMEISALFTVARFRRVDIGALLIVGDELSGDKWRPGFKTDKFKQGREMACRVIRDLCQKI